LEMSDTIQSLDSICIYWLAINSTPLYWSA
jgi:hypothetical protein